VKDLTTQPKTASQGRQYLNLSVEILKLDKHLSLMNQGKPKAAQNVKCFSSTKPQLSAHGMFLKTVLKDRLNQD